MNYAPGEALSPDVPITTLEQYQAWASQDWLYDLGSDQAQLHARAKLEEEASELVEALTAGDNDEIISELGDVLWTATANGQNCGITLADSMRHELSPDYFADESITLAQIDELALELIPEELPRVMANWVNYMAHYVGKAASQWSNLSPEIDPDKQPESFSDAWILLKRERARDGLTQTVLLCSAISQR
ncbi:MAG: MazG nucleotide pyrophosphohydrolase domain, partial [Candidatus Saccharibacteria bacterium]|nr:MazG nucleotide pyrophosphohydrolase domain [Candidatus Saccharibacteria bacterium]